MKPALGRLITMVVLTLFVQAASASTWHALESPDLAGLWPGPDGLWGTNDAAAGGAPAEGAFGPLPLSGITPTNFFTLGGSASSTVDSTGTFGVSVGILTTNGGAPDHPGTNLITDWTGTGSFSNDFVPFVDFAAGFSLDAGAVNQLVVAPGGRTFALDATFTFLAANQSAVFEGTGFNLFAGEDPAVVFAGNAALAAHFGFLAPLAPAGWEVLTTMLVTSESFDLTTGDPLGLTGTGVTVAYTFDAPVPLPGAAALIGLPLLGLAALRRRGGRERRLA